MSDQADVLQPTTGQGDQSTTPYAEYLNRIPEDQRAVVEPIFKEWDAGVTKRFQEASEYRKRFEPYEASLDGVDPSAVAELVQFQKEVLADPGKTREWWQQFGQAQGYADTTDATDELVADGQFTQEQAQAILDQKLGEKLGPLETWMAAQQEKERLAEANQVIESQLRTIQTDLGRSLSTEETDSILTFAQRHDPTTDLAGAVVAGHKDYQALVARIEHGIVHKDDTTPAPATTGGVAPSQAPRVVTRDDVIRQVAEKLAAAEALT